MPTLSILDRLRDLQPETQVEAPMNSWEQLRELERSLCRDLSPSTQHAPRGTGLRSG